MSSNPRCKGRAYNSILVGFQVAVSYELLDSYENELTMASQ